MIRNAIITLTISFTLSVLTIVALHHVSEHITHKQNSFIRVFPPFPITESDTLDLTFNSYYVAGATDHHFYLGNRTAALHVLQLGFNLADTQHIQLSISNMDQYQFRFLKLVVDSPRFYISDGSIPAVFSGNVPEWKAKRQSYDSAYFVDCVPISQQSFALRSVSVESGEYVLGKETSRPPFVTLKPRLLQKQVDGIFCVDGELKYDRASNRLTYTYYYRNEFLLLDTSLNLIQRFNTIDTNSHVKIEVADITSTNSRIMSRPPMMVNKRACSFGNWMFIHSDLMAHNERPEVFKSHSVIDVYDFNKNEYAFSFYIPDFNGEKISDMLVTGSKLIALSGHHVRVFNLTQHYFPKEHQIIHADKL